MIEGLCLCFSVATQRSFPDVPDNYQVEVEANIIDKGYTVDAKIFYDYIGNQAAISTNGKDSFSDWSKYIYSYATNEVFKISNGQGKILGERIQFQGRQLFHFYF